MQNVNIYPRCSFFCTPCQPVVRCPVQCKAAWVDYTFAADAAIAALILHPLLCNRVHDM